MLTNETWFVEVMRRSVYRTRTEFGVIVVWLDKRGDEMGRPIVGDVAGGAREKWAVACVPVFPIRPSATIEDISLI